jgi:DHA1 family bicyclomycin/chloramphenicol resistance-like MFS transporter
LTKPNSSRNAFVLFLALAYALGPFTIDPFTAAFPSIGTTFGVSNAMLQFSMTGVTIGMGLGQIAAGPFSDSIGRKRPMIAAFALYAIGAVASAAAPNMGVFIAMRAVMAIGSSGAGVIAAGMVRDSAEGNAMLKLLSKIFWIQGFAPVFAPILGAQLIQVVDWRAVFQIFGILGVVGALWAFSTRETLAAADRNGSVFGGMGTRFLHVLKDRSYRGLVIISVLTTIQLYAYLNLFPFVFYKVLHVDQSTYGLLAASVSFSWLISFQVGTFLSPRWGYLRTLTLAMVLGALGGIGGLTAGVAWPNLWLVMGLLYLGTFGFGMSTGPLQTLALAPHGEEAGTAAALMGTLNFLITSLLSPIYTLLPTNSMAGIAGAYLVCYLLGLASTLLIVKPALRGASLR